MWNCFHRTRILKVSLHTDPREGCQPTGNHSKLAALIRSLVIENRRYRMDLPNAPIAHEGFFAAQFFTVSDQDKSKNFYVRILGGRVIKPDNPCYIKLANTCLLYTSPSPRD